MLINERRPSPPHRFIHYYISWKKTWKIILNLLVLFWLISVCLAKTTNICIYNLHQTSVVELKEFELRLKFETRLKHGWFSLKLHSVFRYLSRRLIKIGFGRSTSWLVFLNFYISYHKHSFQPIVEARNKIQIFISMVSTLHPLIIIYSDEPIHRVLLLHDSNRYKDLLV